MSTTKCTSVATLCANCAPLYHKLKPFFSDAELFCPTTTTFPMMLCNKFKGSQFNSATATGLQGEIAYRASVLTRTDDCKVHRANKPDPVINFCLLKIMVDWPIPDDTDEKFKWDLLDNLHILFLGIDRMEWEKWTIVPPELGQCASYARLYFFYEVAKDKKQA